MIAGVAVGPLSRRPSFFSAVAGRSRGLRPQPTRPPNRRRVTRRGGTAMQPLALVSSTLAGVAGRKPSAVSARESRPRAAGCRATRRAGGAPRSTPSGCSGEMDARRGGGPVGAVSGARDGWWWTHGLPPDGPPLGPGPRLEQVRRPENSSAKGAKRQVRQLVHQGAAARRRASRSANTGFPEAARRRRPCRPGVRPNGRPGECILRPGLGSPEFGASAAAARRRAGRRTGRPYRRPRTLRRNSGRAA